MEYTKGEWVVKGAEFTEEGTVLFEIKLPTQQISAADANLIKAAPDMYEALKLTVDWFAEVRAYIPTHAFTLSKIEQALAKAEGNGTS